METITVTKAQGVKADKVEWKLFLNSSDVSCFQFQRAIFGNTIVQDDKKDKTSVENEV